MINSNTWKNCTWFIFEISNKQFDILSLNKSWWPIKSGLLIWTNSYMKSINNSLNFGPVCGICFIKYDKKFSIELHNVWLFCAESNNYRIILDIEILFDNRK